MAPDLNGIRKTYEEDGYVVVRNVLDADLIGEMSQHIEWLMSRNPGVRPERLGHDLIADDPFWCRVISDQRLLDVAESFIGPDIALFASSYFSKPPYDGLPVAWHQDGSYWPLEPQDAVVSLWIAVDDSTPENGCLRVIPGSHHMDFKELVRGDDTPNVFELQTPAEAIDESRAVDVVLKAGDVSIHNPRMVHGSNANKSAKRRCGLTIRYIPTSTRIVRGLPGQRGAFWNDDKAWPNGKWPCAYLLRGKAGPGVNDYLEMPRFDNGRHMPFRGCQEWTPSAQALAPRAEKQRHGS